MAYLDTHPPARPQFRCPRRATPSGVVVVHTAESILDLVGGDHGAENVAYFIATRTDAPGSYHDLVDSDSIVDVVRYECEAFQDGTGSNPHAYGLSGALRAADWPRLTKAKRDAFVENYAQAAARYARWVKKTHGVTIPARRISRAESEARVPGFISHGERDPGRRTDPGAEFPWTQFLDRFAALMGYNQSDPSTPEDDVLAFAYLKDDRPANAATGFKPVAGVHLYALHGATAVHQTGASWKKHQELAAFFGTKPLLWNSSTKPFGFAQISGLDVRDGPLRGL